MARNDTLPKDLQKIENRLMKALQPVQPNMRFVEELRTQLDQQMLSKVKTNKVKTGLLVAGGIVGAVVMVITVIRSIMNWPNVIQTVGERFRKREQIASV
jgi:hypothetical protein